MKLYSARFRIGKVRMTMDVVANSAREAYNRVRIAHPDVYSITIEWEGFA